MTKLKWTLPSLAVAILTLLGTCNGQQLKPGDTCKVAEVVRVNPGIEPAIFEPIVDCSDTLYRGVSAARSKQLETAVADLDASRKVITDQQADIASLHREIGLLNQVASLGDKIDKLRADQLTQFSQFALRQQSTLNAVESAVTVPPKSRLQRFAESWQLSFGLKALGAGANARTLFAPPSFGPCPVR